MPPKSLPLDVISVIIEEVEFGTKSDKTTVLMTLKACSLLCRTWKDVAQRRLLRKVVFADRKWYDQAYQPHQNRSLYPSFPSFVENARANPGFLSHIRILIVEGRSVVSDACFPEILRLIAEAGELQAFSWNMACSRDCPHWCQFPEPLRLGIEAMCKLPRLTSLQLLKLCQQFPMEIVGHSPLEYLELEGTGQKILKPPHFLRSSGRLGRLPLPPVVKYPAGTKAKIKSLKLEGSFRNKILEYYLERPELGVDFSELRELRIDVFENIRLANALFDTCSSTISSLGWKFTPLEFQSWNQSVKLNLRRLTNLRILNIETFMDVADSWIEHCDLPINLKTLNVTIEHAIDADAEKADQADLYVEAELYSRRLDRRLSNMILNAQANSRLREVNIYYLLHGYTEALRDARLEVELDGLSEAGNAEDLREEPEEVRFTELADVAAGVASSPEVRNRETIRQEIQEYGDYWMVLSKALDDMKASTPPWLLPDDEVEARLRAKGVGSGHGSLNHWYTTLKDLPTTVPTWYLHLQATGIVKWHVMDYEDMPRLGSCHNIW